MLIENFVFVNSWTFDMCIKLLLPYLLINLLTYLLTYPKQIVGTEIYTTCSVAVLTQRFSFYLWRSITDSGGKYADCGLVVHGIEGTLALTRPNVKIGTSNSPSGYCCQKTIANIDQRQPERWLSH